MRRRSAFRVGGLKSEVVRRESGKELMAYGQLAGLPGLKFAVQDEVLLGRRVDVATATPAGLAEWLEEFAGIVEQWRQRLGSGELVAPDAESAAPWRQPGMYLLG